jgi:hypothetical protein
MKTAGTGMFSTRGTLDFLQRISPLLALRWHNLPCALKAAIGIGKRTLAILAAPAAFAAAWMRGKADLAAPA